MQLGKITSVFGHDFFHVFRRTFLFCLHKGADHMSIQHRHACAGGADAESCALNCFTVKLTQNFLWFAFHFRFLARNIRHNVFGHIHRRKPGSAARAGHCLLGNHHHLFYAKSILYRFERNNQAGNRAIGLGGNKTLPAAVFLLHSQKRRVVHIDASHQNGCVVFITKSRCCANYRSGFRVFWFQFFCHCGIHSGKNYVHGSRIERSRFFHSHIGDALR
ncbi:MAG: hypothetical protein BWY90_01427 [Deltaproteobacteria bacterium ADurb.BinA014]|nr:MAG: hypothetical protein BWY90_01427 [Deltaproteobacteria bacterium ADurb.BinA014]